MNNISGKTEFDVFKNYYTAEQIKDCNLTINGLSLQSKDNVVSERLRGLAKSDFAAGNFYVCLEKYTECLRYATCNGREYAMALANRSATYFAMKNYQNCLTDISLSLRADYPINLKPKMLIRKAKCFIKLGNFKKMVETIDECRNLVQDSNLPKIDQDNFMKEMKALVDTRQIDIDELPLEENTFAPEVILRKNQKNPNVSDSIELKYNKNTGTDYVAARDISRGEVLFVDVAYSTCFVKDIADFNIGRFVCNYCCNEAKNCIPCKNCNDLVYCSENCLDSSWTEYHQWECDMFRSEYLPRALGLPLRTLIKGAFSGEIFKKPCKPSKDMDPYLHVYSLNVDLASFRSKSMSFFVDTCKEAALMIGFLKKTNFFTRLMSTSSCQKDYRALVNFVGGLLIRHTVQAVQRCLTMNCTTSMVSISENERKFDFVLPEKSLKYFAICPLVSEVKYSCKPNTSMYFNGNTCIVKACENIKAGDRIFRSGYNMTPEAFFFRQELLGILGINCDCTACEDINNNGDVLNTFLCNQCYRFAVLRPTDSSFMICNNCNCTSDLGEISCMIASQLFCNMMRENVQFNNQKLRELISIRNTLIKIANPNHERLYVCYKNLLEVYSELENINNLNETLSKFKTCAENINRRFNIFNYMIDLMFICKTCLTYLQCNKSNLLKRETTEMLTYISNTINEAKEIAEYTFPPLLRLFTQLEFYILKFRISRVAVED